MFSSRSCIKISGFTFRSMINFELMFVYGVRYESHIFVYGCPVLPAPCIEKIYSFFTDYLCTLSKVYYSYMCGFISVFCCIDLFVYFYTNTTVF